MHFCINRTHFIVRLEKIKHNCNIKETIYLKKIIIIKISSAGTIIFYLFLFDVMNFVSPIKNIQLYGLNDIE